MVLNKIGLTGSNGMLGRHIYAALREEGAEVVSISRTHTIKNGEFYWNLAEWAPLEDLDIFFDGVQAVIHAGAMLETSDKSDMSSMFDTNVRACLNLCEWAISRNIPIIYISGAIVYANSYDLNQREDATLGRNMLGGFYGFSKLLAEDIFIRFSQQGLRLGIVRPSSIYGSGMGVGKMIKRFLSAAKANETIDLIHPVDDRIDFVHAFDVSRAIIEMLKKESWNIFNISSRIYISIRELAETSIQLTGRGSLLIKGQLSMNYKPTIKYSLDTSLAKNCLGWSPEINIEQGMLMMLQEKNLPSSTRFKEKIDY